MSEELQHLPPRLSEIAADFRAADKQEKLELLLEYSEQLPVLPERYLAEKESLEQVPECMTPIFIAAESIQGGFFLHFDIPPESPTVRGFAEILRDGTAGLTQEQILSIPSDFHYIMGMQSVLSPQRLNGIYFMLAHIKRLVTREAAKNR